MKIGCVYTVDSYFEVDRPFSAATEIPFGLSIIIIVLEQQGHIIELFVITPETDLAIEAISLGLLHSRYLVKHDYSRAEKSIQKPVKNRL